MCFAGHGMGGSRTSPPQQPEGLAKVGSGHIDAPGPKGTSIILSLS